MELTVRDKKILNKCVCDLTKSELKRYQEINKQRLEEKLESIRKMQDLTGQDPIYVHAALGYIPYGYSY